MSDLADAIGARPGAETRPPPPPLIKGRPIVGFLPEYRRDAVRLFMRMADEGGDICRFRVGPKVVTLINNPDYAGHVLKTHWKRYPKSENYDEVVLLLRGDIATTDGPEWIRFRRRSASALSRRHFSDLPAVVSESAEDVFPAAVPRHPDQPVDVYELAMRMGARIASRMLFGSDIRGEADRLEPALRAGFDFVSSRIEKMVKFPATWPLPSHLRFRREIALIDSIVASLIDGVKSGDADDQCMLRDLISAAEEEGTSENAIAREVLNESIFLYNASLETPGTAVAWMLFLLSRNPEVRARIEKEIDSVIGDRALALADLSSLPVLTAAIQETLRLYPTIWLMSRTASETDEIGGYTIKRGSMVMIAPYVLHRRPDIWPDPEEFVPDRFLGDQGPPKNSYIPFSIGPHSCVGANLASAEMLVIFATLLRRFRFEMSPGQTGAYRSGVTLRPEGGLMMTITPR
ncbi:MAG: cytochrome P450 [Pseudomonadota bacterium]